MTDLKVESTEQRISRWHRSAHPIHYPPGVDDDRILAGKLAEEAGEVNGAAIRIVEGRNTLADLRGEIGDVLICLSVIAGRHGWTLADIRSDKWAELDIDWSQRFGGLGSYD